MRGGGVTIASRSGYASARAWLMRARFMRRTEPEFARPTQEPREWRSARGRQERAHAGQEQLRADGHEDEAHEAEEDALPAGRDALADPVRREQRHEQHARRDGDGHEGVRLAAPARRLR